MHYHTALGCGKAEFSPRNWVSFMLKTFLATISLLIFGVSAMAADLAPAYKAPGSMPIAYNWTGFYVGGSLGARWSTVNWRTLDFDTQAAQSSDNPADVGSTGVRAGGYVGYNWMLTPSFLAGLEADVAWGNNSKTHPKFPGEGTLGPGTGLDFVTAKLGWDGSVRGRFGVLPAPNVLLYATGGVAWQEIRTSASCNGTSSNASFCSSVVSESSSSTKSGWTIGGGVETMLSPNWLARVEYRFADFGHVSNRLVQPVFDGFHADIAVKTNTALAGVAYKF
jgi:outer membrane immunogenic protein